MRKAASTDFATKSLATRWRLRSTLRPSRIIGGIEAKPPFTRTMSAMPRAICEPVPWAMARRAAFRAGTSLTPSPTIAT